jgi:hypothetical protein
MCGHRDTNTYPAKPNTAGSIAIIPNATLSMFAPSLGLTGTVLGFASAGENAIGDNSHGRRAGRAIPSTED